MIPLFLYSSADETFWKAALQGDLGDMRAKISRRCCQVCGASEAILILRSTTKKIKGPDNPTSQLLPIMSFNWFSGDREGRKDKGGGERSRR